MTSPFLSFLLYSNEIEELLPRLKMLQNNALGSNRQARNFFSKSEVAESSGLKSASDVEEMRSNLLASVQSRGELRSFRDTLKEEAADQQRRVKRQGRSGSGVKYPTSGQEFMR